MRNLILLAAFICGLLASVQHAAAGTEIPFEYRSGMIWVNVQVDGHPQPLRFLLDSGASSTVLDVKAAQRLGLKLGNRETARGVEGSCSAYRVNGISARVGGVPISRSALAIDLGAVSRSAGGRMDGLLGADFFRGRTLQIDYAAGRLCLLAPGESPKGVAEVVPLSRRNGVWCVRVSVDGNRAQWMRLDTGCSSALEWVAGSGTASTGKGNTMATSTGGPSVMETEVELGNLHISAVRTGLHTRPMFAGESGLVGNALLSRFRVTLDGNGSRLLLSRE